MKNVGQKHTTSASFVEAAPSGLYQCMDLDCLCSYMGGTSKILTNQTTTRKVIIGFRERPPGLECLYTGKWSDFAKGCPKGVPTAQ